MTHDEEGRLPPSALIPFCFYQKENSFLGRQRPEMNNITVCDKFQPTILEGQLCYSLKIAKLSENHKKSTKSGKEHGLLLLLDPKPYQLNHTEQNAESSMGNRFKVFIHTLHTHTTFGPGELAMTTLKKMTSTKSFKQLPDYQRKCLDHSREECQTQKYLDQVQKECKCIPWALRKNQVRKSKSEN